MQARLVSDLAADLAAELGERRRGRSRGIGLTLDAGGLIETEQLGPIELDPGGRFAGRHDLFSPEVITESVLQRKRGQTTGQRESLA